MAQAAAASITSSLSKAQKAALIFLLIEEKGAASLFQHFSDSEIKRIGTALLKLDEIPVQEMSYVLGEFYTEMGVSRPDGFSGKRLFEKVVDKALPKERKRKVLFVKDIKAGKEAQQFNPFGDLFDALADDQIHRLIKDEHPQTQAVILALMKSGQSRGVLNLFESEQQVDLLYRMSILAKVPEDAVVVMADNYKAKLSSGAAQTEEKQGKQSVDVPGVDLVLRYLKSQDWAKAEATISQIEKTNPDVAAALRKKFFTLEDMLRSDNNGVRGLLKTIETATLSVALKNQNEKVQNKFFQNMSTRAATIMKEDMEVMPEQKPEDVEAASNKILEEAKRLISEGQMILEPIADA